MLFHRGEYLGTATWLAYSFTPSVSRISDRSIEVVYRYLQDGDMSHAAASGRAVATFTWNDETHSVDMAGEVPPDIY